MNELLPVPLRLTLDFMAHPSSDEPRNNQNSLHIELTIPRTMEEMDHRMTATENFQIQIATTGPKRHLSTKDRSNDKSQCLVLDEETSNKSPSFV
jgi:hypothetical protein